VKTSEPLQHPLFFKKRQEQLKQLLRAVEHHQKKLTGVQHYSVEGLQKLETAFWIADWAHRGQKRASGRPYFEHPYAAALMAAKDAQPVEMIIGLLLHDVPENQTPEEFKQRGEAAPTVESLEKLFGRPVAKFVSVLTNPRWNGKRWVLPEAKEFYSLPLRPEDFTDEMREDRETIYRNILFSPGNNLEAVGKYYDVLHNGKTLEYLEPEQRERYFKRYRDEFHLLAAVVSKKLARKGLDALKAANRPVGVRLENLFEREHKHWSKKPFHEALPHRLFPALVMIKNHPPAGVKKTVIAYWKGLRPEEPFVVEIPKTVSEATARVLLRDLGVQQIAPVESMLHGTLRMQGAGHLFTVSFDQKNAAELQKQFRNRIGRLFGEHLRAQRIGMARARKRVK